MLILLVTQKSENQPHGYIYILVKIYALGRERNNQQFSDQVHAEVEYRTLATLATEVRWSTFICRDLGQIITDIPLIFCNSSIIFMAYNPVIKQRSKHIETQNGIYFTKACSNQKLMLLSTFS